MTGPREDLRRLRWLWPHLREHGPVLVRSVLAGLLAQLGMVGAAVTGAVLVGRTLAGSGTAYPVGLLVLAGGLVLMAGLCTWWEMYLSHDLAYVVVAGLRVRVYDRLRLALPRRSDGRRSGDLSTTALSDVDRLEWLIAHVLGQVVVTTVVVTGTTVAAGIIAPVSLLVLLPAGAVLVTVPWWFRVAADRQGRAERAAAAHLQADVVETVNGLDELAAAGALPQRRADLAHTTERVVRIGRQAAGRAGAESAISDTLVALASVAVLFLLTATAQDGRLDIATAPVQLTLAGAALLPLVALAGTLQQLGAVRASVGRVLDVLALPDSVPPGRPPTEPVETPDSTVTVEFDQVDFAYGTAEPVLRRVSFTAERGSTVALVGPSGAGKSTLVALVQRFFDPDSGVVRLLGRDLREYDDEELRRTVAVVAQQVQLFSGTVTDNLLLGRPTADSTAVREAVAVAQADGVVDGLERGADTLVGERGATLSGGERARLAIARALVVGAPVLVLDEAVAGLDAENERALHQALRHGAADRTTIVVAHRRSTIRRADQVVVLREGRVVAVGTPDQTAPLWSSALDENDYH